MPPSTTTRAARTSLVTGGNAILKDKIGDQVVVHALPRRSGGSSLHVSNS
ncbi:hypothetical protein [Bradyrhizobium oligotrophicum]